MYVCITIHNVEILFNGRLGHSLRLISHVHLKVVSFSMVYIIMQVVQDQFGPSWETLTPKKFQLRTRIGVQNQQKIEINFQKIPESGWSLSLESESKVLKL